jgi:hypothetical protein
MRQVRGKQFLGGIGVLAALMWGCESSSTPGGFQRDNIPPTLTLTTSADTQTIANGLSFTVTATDNLALNDVQLTYSGGYLAQTDTIFRNQTLTSFTQTVGLTPAQLSGAGGVITIAGRATDGAGNPAVDTLRIFLINVQALRVTLVQPATGAVSSPGKYVPIQVIAVQRSGVQKVGWLISPPTGQTGRSADSIITAGAPPFPDSVNFVDSVLVTGVTGTFTVVGFAVDSGGRLRTSSQVTVNILSAANDTTPPQIQQFVTLRAEATDTITVHATDPSGISVIGFKVTDITGATLLRRDSVVLSGTSTDVTHTFSLQLFGVVPPVKVVIQAFACDASARHNCGVTGQVFTVPSPSGAAHADTVLIVGGTTRALPVAGSSIADAIFDANRNELYLTNPALSRVEIFQVANSSFVAAGIPTAGPVPWGVALWPRDTLGHYADTIVVANTGGTQLSVIDVAARVLRWRQDLPDFLIETYKVLSVPGGWKTLITVYDVSDRPQYVATVCRTTSGSTACAPDSIYALYSTAPLPSNPGPFQGHGTLRMEKLVNPGSPVDTSLLFGHLFWEISNAPPGSTTDTLRIELVRGKPGVAGFMDKVVLSACAGQNVLLSSIALGDTTFARNSGNFTHGFFGEGGNLAAPFARVMSYTTGARLFAGAATATSCFTDPGKVTSDAGNNDIDFGMSPAVNVNDFISNTATRVRAIATNFNGLTNIARADSLYYLDQALRLKATSPDSGIARGMDMNYDHNFAPTGGCPPSTPACGGSGSPNNRIVFAARFDGNIDVFDTFFGQRLGAIPIRDPIIGPLRVAKDPTGTFQILFGITGKGLVMVRLPTFVNPLPAPPRR